MTLASMTNDLLRFVPLNLDIIKSNLQDSYLQLASKDWNRLNLQRMIYTATIYSTGTVSVAADGTVTGVGTTFTSAMVGRFMKVHYTDSFFTIDTYTSGTVIKLKDWPGAVVVAGTSYSIFKTIYPVPTEFGIIYEIVYQVPLYKKSQTYFNKVDPARTSTASSPLWWAYAGVDASGVIQIEIYPVPVDVVGLRVYGKMKIATLADGDTPYLPEELVKARALLNCYRMKDLQQPKQGWAQKIEEQTAFYAELFSTYQEEDYQLDAHPDRVKDRMGEPSFPQDDNFALTHDVD
jgi:hypothetical protein